MESTVATDELAQSNVTPQDINKPSTAVFTTRAAVESDAEGISHMGQEVFIKTFGHSCSEKDMEGYLEANFTPTVIRNEIGRADMSYLVACEGERIVAFCVLRLGTSEECVESYPERVELQRFYVDSAYHGKGVARVIMDATIALAVEQGHQTMWLGVWEHNERAKGFYRKFGFVHVGSHDFMLGEEHQIDDVWVKSIV